MNCLEFVDGSLSKRKHRYVAVVFIIPSVLLDVLVKLVHQIMLVLQVVGLLLVVVTPVSGVESADIVQFVNLVAV